MAIFFDAPVTPDALTTYIRQIPIPRRLTLLNLFPARYVDDNRVDWGTIIQTNRTARYRSFDGRIHVSQRDTGSNSWVNLLPLSSSLSMGELERLQLEFARTGGTNTRGLAGAVYNDGTNLTREVQNRLNLAWGDVLTDGVLTINEEGFQGIADFGVPGTQKVTAGTLWTASTSAPILDNLLTWNDVYVARNGQPAGAMRTSLRMLRAMQTNTQLVGAIAGTTLGRTRVTTAEINDLLVNNELPPLSPILLDDQVDVDGTATRIVPNTQVYFTPADDAMGDLGHTTYGISATALELVDSNEADLSFEEAAGIVGVVEKVGPPYRQFTFVDAVAMPTLENAQLLMIATVGS